MKAMIFVPIYLTLGAFVVSFIRHRETHESPPLPLFTGMVFAWPLVLLAAIIGTLDDDK